MLLVGNDSRAGKVEAVLVELSLVSVSDEVTVNARLQLEGIGVDQGIRGILEGCEVDGAQASQVASIASHSRRYVEEEGLGVLMAGSWDKSRGHDICLLEELFSVTCESSHLEEDLRASS